MTDDSERTIRIAIVNDHPIVRYGMTLVLNAQPGFAAVCAAESAAALRQDQCEKDVVIIDLHPERGRLQADEITAVACDYPVLVMSPSASRPHMQTAICAGACGYIIKTADTEEFVQAVRVVAAGGVYFSAEAAGLLQDTGSCREEPVLSAREREVLALIAQGFTQPQAAARMRISPATIDTYIKRIKRKLGPGNKAELTRRAMELGHLKLAAVSAELRPCGQPR